MEIMEMATALGKLIKSSEEYKKYEAADAAYDSDEALGRLIAEYNAQQEAYSNEQQKAEPNQFLLETVAGRLETLYGEITANEAFMAYSEAQNALNNLMQEVNNEITFQVTGHRPCSHEDCEACGGHCHD